ncbi:hypothetical protein [Mangrovicoccus sp. HB161399]|uniref:hypothetical protein n=1 Tax=Mangrovicoccus sp. HB161399 TaxID=2720392 RepID=UPI0015580B6F|nr:hypothetical protein [Mangrovicoccus sp. HB161399]
MADLPGLLLNAADLPVRVLSVAAGRAIGGLMNLRTMFSRKDAAAALAERIVRDLQGRFDAGGGQKDDETLFPQMLVSAMPAPAGLAAADLSAQRVLDRMAARLADMDPESAATA